MSLHIQENLQRLDDDNLKAALNHKNRVVGYITDVRSLFYIYLLCSLNTWKNATKFCTNLILTVLIIINYFCDLSKGTKLCSTQLISQPKLNSICLKNSGFINRQLNYINTSSYLFLLSLQQLLISPLKLFFNTIKTVA